MKVMMTKANPYHTSVLLQACIDNLNIQPNGVYVDLTFGGGGHSKEILRQLGKDGKLFAFDQDEDAQRNTIRDERFVLIPHNFRFVKNYLRLNGVTKVNGILGDLGVSSHQFDEVERGFSFRGDATLDMRMNRKQELSAETIVNEYDEEKLIKLLKDYAEVTSVSRIARLIIEKRTEARIKTTEELMNVLKPVTPKFEGHKFLAQIFQGLRIEVNAEMDALKECLAQCTEILMSGGRLVVISYHSLEDRLVKNLIRSGNVEGIEERDPVYGTTKKIFKNLTSKPIVPTEDEIKNNTRARSAKLRVGEKL
jgi:16S rRNA (cytosine1402-N4)-methyltransferase